MKIKETQYAKTLYALTKNKDHHEIDGVVSNFLKVLIKNGQVKLATKIIQKFNEIWNSDEGIIEAQVVSTHKLESAQLHKIESYLKEKYDSKKVLINNKVDESIKGGIIIKVKDEVLDGSIANQLKMLKNNLSK